MVFRRERGLWGSRRPFSPNYQVSTLFERSAVRFGAAGHVDSPVHQSIPKRPSGEGRVSVACDGAPRPPSCLVLGVVAAVP